MTISKAQMRAVMSNGAGLAMDKYLRRLLDIRHNSPADPLYQAMHTGGYGRTLWDEVGLLRPETDLFIDPHDFLLWYQEWLNAQPAEPGKAAIVQMTALEPDTIYSANFINPWQIAFDSRPGYVEFKGFSICQNDLHSSVLLLGNTHGAPGDLDQRTVVALVDDTSLRLTDYIVNEGLLTWESFRDKIDPIITAADTLAEYLKTCETEVIQHKTDYSPVKERIKEKKEGTSRPQDRIQFRVIRKLKRIHIYPKRTVEGGERAAPEFKVNVQGFWRKIEGMGFGPDRTPVVGKTWVRSHTRWNDKPEKKTVYVKEPLRGQAEQ